MFNNDYDKATWLKAVQESGVSAPEAVSAKFFTEDGIFQIFVTEADVESDGETLRGVLVEKWFWDKDDPKAVDYVEQLSLDVWTI